MKKKERNNVAIYCRLSKDDGDSLESQSISNQKEILTKLYNSKKPEFVVITGRRRVGKTYLVNSFFEEKFTLFWRNF